MDGRFFMRKNGGKFCLRKKFRIEPSLPVKLRLWEKFQSERKAIPDETLTEGTGLAGRRCHRTAQRLFGSGGGMVAVPLLEHGGLEPARLMPLPLR